ncbi:MAG TPA: D-2-hydroxyacid dehydrogenase, partial [Acidimicrobiales bacterium]|nr:D-2-hydroxyacid dehydrogenase [Acidimicrobiales bacterium]
SSESQASVRRTSELPGNPPWSWGGRIVLSNPFAPLDVEGLRRALGPDFDLQALDGTDQRAVDDAMGTDVVALLAQERPSDWSAAPQLRWMQTLSAGVEHLVPAEGWPTNVTLTNARGVYATAIGQYVLGAMLRIAEHMDARNAVQAARRWPENGAAYAGRSLRGARLVLVGYGGGGREIARLGAAVGMRIRAVEAHPERRVDNSFRVSGTGDPDGSLPEDIVPLAHLRETVADADFVTITVPLTVESRHLIDSSVLAAMPPDAWLINVSRGAVVDQAALIKTLDEGRIGGAVLDVFEEEPLPADSPLWYLKGVVLTPHVAGWHAGDALQQLLEENLARFAGGRPVINAVDPARGY